MSIVVRLRLEPLESRTVPTAGYFRIADYNIASSMSAPASGLDTILQGSANEHVNAFTTGRLATDALGTLRDGPGGTAFPGYTSSSTAYNPGGDGGNPRRWGDYSFVSVDPNDDMTMWTIQEYCNGTDTYGVQAVQLIAPPPATPLSAAPPSVASGSSPASASMM